MTDALAVQARRSELVSSLRLRLEEIADSIVEPLDARTIGVRQDASVAFREAQRSTALSCLEYWLLALGQGEPWRGPAPAAVGTQAQLAAQHGIPVTTVFLGYLRGCEQAWPAVLDELDSINDPAARIVQQQAWRATTSLLACLIEAVGVAHAAQLAQRADTPERQQAEAARRLLAGDPRVDRTILGVDLDGWHLGVVALGARARLALEMLAERCGCRLLLLSRSVDAVVGWVCAGSAPLSTESIERHMPDGSFGEVRMAFGRFAQGVDGLRLTHRLSNDASLVARRQEQRSTWYADVELEAHALRDPSFASSLVSTYVAPMDDALRTTLRAYYAAQRNEARAAGRLSVDRATVRRRLVRAESLLERSLSRCHGSIELALRLEELGVEARILPNERLRSQ